MQSGRYRRNIRGGRRAISDSTGKTDAKILAKRNIKVSDSFFEPSVNPTLRAQYFEGLKELSKDFPLDSLEIDIYKISRDTVGYSRGGRLIVGKDYIEGKEVYGKGNGSLSWHSAHEYAHQIQNRLMIKAYKNGEYPSIDKFRTDVNSGTTISKSILLDANAKANKIEGVNKTVYERLQSISNYANPKNKWAKATWREGHSETMGKYIQSKRDKSDVFGRLVYEETLRRYKK